MTARPVIGFVREVIDKWLRDRALSQGAALAYYALFSIAPLLVLVIAIAGLVLGRAAAQGELVTRIGGVMGPDAARVIEGLVLQASQPRSGLVATLSSLTLMLFGATGVFGQLKTSLNDIFGAEPRPSGGVRGMLRQRIAAFGLILGIGALLWLSLLLSAILSVVDRMLAAHLPVLSRLLPVLNFGGSFLVVTALFAMLFRVLPDVEMRWRDVWLGAAFTSLLFTIGKSLIGWYLGRAGTASVYGAASSLVVVLLWVYYSSQILFLGAEFTDVYSRRYGSRSAAPERAARPWPVEPPAVAAPPDRR